MSRLVEQQRARFALKCCADMGKISAELLSAVNSLPAMVLMNGVGQAAAFYRAKGGAHRKVYDALAAWLCHAGGDGLLPGVYAGETDLLKALTEGDQIRYRAAQAEAIAFLQWLKNAIRASNVQGNERYEPTTC